MATAIVLVTPAAQALELRDALDGFQAVIDDDGGCVATSTSSTAVGKCDDAFGAYIRRVVPRLKSDDAELVAAGTWRAGTQRLFMAHLHGTKKFPSDFDLEAYAAKGESPLLDATESALGSKIELQPSTHDARAERVGGIPTIFYERDFVGAGAAADLHGRLFVREMFLERSQVLMALVAVGTPDERWAARARIDAVVKSVRGTPAPVESPPPPKAPPEPVNYWRVGEIAVSALVVAFAGVIAFVFVRRRRRQQDETATALEAQREAEEATLDPLERRRRKLLREESSNPDAKLSSRAR